MKHLNSKEDIEFKRQFESCEFPVAEFNHKAHLRLAYVYLSKNNTDSSIELMRESLMTYSRLICNYLLIMNNLLDSTL